jgi:undecaprenyl-diphosphatase
MLRFNLLAATTFFDSVSAFDNSVYKLVSSWMTEGLTSFMKIISFIGSGWILTLIALIAITIELSYRKALKWSLMIALNLITVSLLNNIIKVIIHRPRPDIMQLVEVGGYSFPSWHAMTAICFFGYLSYLIMAHYKRWTRYIFAGLLGLLILTIGISRIYLGVYYASDVLCGYIIGLVWLTVFIWLTNRFSFWSRFKK